MKNYTNYIKESLEEEYDILFLKLAHLDELEIKFNFIKHKKDIFYFYNDSCLFFKTYNQWFFINYNIYSIFYNNIDIISSIIQKYFKNDENWDHIWDFKKPTSDIIETNLRTVI